MRLEAEHLARALLIDAHDRRAKVAAKKEARVRRMVAVQDVATLEDR